MIDRSTSTRAARPTGRDRRSPATRLAAGDGGFALVEMIVAIGLLLTVTVMVFLTFFRARNEIGRISGLVTSRQAGRAAIQLIERDVRMSGSGRGKVAINYSRNGTADSLFAVNPGPGSGSNDSLRIVGAWSATTTTSATLLAFTSTLTVASVTGFAVNDLAMIVDKDGKTAHMFQVTGVNSGTNQLAHANTSTWNVLPASWNWPAGGYAIGSYIYKMDILAYSVDGTNFRRPALVRRAFNGTPQVVSYELNQFRVYYRLQDGTLTRTPTVSGTGIALIDKVRPVVVSTVTDPRRATYSDSVWTEVRPRTF